MDAGQFSYSQKRQFTSLNLEGGLFSNFMKSGVRVQRQN